MTNDPKRKTWMRNLLGIALVASLALSVFPQTGQSAPADRVYIVEGLSTDRENSVQIDLYIEPFSKFEAILAGDPLAATDPARIINDASITENTPGLPNLEKTLFLKMVDPPVPAGTNVEFSEDVSQEVRDLANEFHLLPNIRYIVLAVYTDNVLRSTDGISTPSLILYGTRSPGFFIFDDLPPTPTITPTPTPTLSGQPTPTPTFTPPPDAAWPVAIGSTPGDRLVQGVAIDDVVRSDPNLEVVAVAQTGKLKVFSYLGISWPDYETNLNVTVDTAPVTADIDGDGEIEIVIGTNELDSDRNMIYSTANAVLSIDNEFKQKYQDLVALNTPPTPTILQSVGLLNAIHYIPQGQIVFGTPAVYNLDGGSDLEVIFTTRPMAADGSSYVQVVSFSDDPNTPPVTKMSIQPRRLVKTGRVLISELNPNVGTTSAIRAELTNVSGAPIDLKNWSVIFYDSSTWPEPTAVAPIGDTASVVGAGAILTVVDRATAADTTLPQLGIVRGLTWSPSSTRMAIALRDSQGRVVDFVTSGNSSQILNPVPITTDHWAGSGLLLPPTTGSSFQRVANAENLFRDNNNRGDWVGNAGSNLGSLNPSLAIPFYQGVGILGEAAVGDVDGDTFAEIVVGSKLGDLYAFEMNPASPVDPIVAPVFELNDSSLEQPALLRSPALVDIDNDSDLEILIAVSERDGGLPGRTQLHFVHGNGTPVFAQSLIYTPTQLTSSLSTPVVGLAHSNPGADKIALFATRRGIVILNLSQGGQTIFEMDVPNTSEAFASSAPAIGQAQPQALSDEVFEFFIGGGGGTQGNLIGYYYDTSTSGLTEVTGILDHVEPTAPGTGAFSPILGGIELADLNGDRQTEVVYTNEIGFINVFSPMVPARSDNAYLEPNDFPWPAFKHDRARTGAFSDSTFPNPVSPYRAGDINRDGFINELDLFSIAEKWSHQDMFKGISADKGPADHSNAPHIQLLGVLSGLKR